MTRDEIVKYFNEQEYGPDITYTFMLTREMKEFILNEFDRVEKRVRELKEGLEMMKFGWDEEIKMREQAESRLKELQGEIHLNHVQSYSIKF